MTIVQSIYGYCYFMCTKKQLQSCIWHILLALHQVVEWMLCAFLEQICMSCVKCLPYSGCSRITFGNIIIIIHSTYVQFEHYPVTADVARCMRLITQCGLHGLAFVLELGVISAYYVHVRRTTVWLYEVRVLTGLANFVAGQTNNLGATISRLTSSTRNLNCKTCFATCTRV